MLPAEEVGRKFGKLFTSHWGLWQVIFIVQHAVGLFDVSKTKGLLSCPNAGRPVANHHLDFHVLQLRRVDENESVWKVLGEHIIILTFCDLFIRYASRRRARRTA